MSDQEPHDGLSSGTGGGGCLLRMLWMVAGNFVLALCLFSLFSTRSAFPSVWDGVFWGTVVLLVGIRYLDIARFKGATVTGAPASMRTWVKYVVLLVVGSAVLWGVARLMVHMTR